MNNRVEFKIETICPICESSSKNNEIKFISGIGAPSRLNFEDSAMKLNYIDENPMAPKVVVNGKEVTLRYAGIYQCKKCKSVFVGWSDVTSEGF